MVQQVIDKFNEYTSMHNGSATATKLSSDKMMSNPLESSPSAKEKGPLIDSVKEFGTKRLQPDSPLNPSKINRGVNGHIVYVRRKVDSDRVKKSILNVSDSSSSILTVKSGNEETKELKLQWEKTHECNNEISFSHGKSNEISHPHVNTTDGIEPDASQNPSSLELNAHIDLKETINNKVDLQATSINKVDPQNTSSNTAPIDPPRSSESKEQVDPQKRTDHQGWKERYLKLQMFLKNCDQSSQEDYITMLQSLTAAGRSKLALELEKRALHLLLEEGKELHRMQVLNVIGQTTPLDQSSPSTRLQTNCNPKSPFLRKEQ